MPKYAAFALLLLSIFAAVSNAHADTRLGDSCDLSILGINDKTEFLRFDSALRSALKGRDAAALALLVQFPLALNYPDGSHVSLGNAAALQKQFDEAFPSTAREIVAGQKSDALFCKADGGVMSGNGELWVDLVGEGKTRQFRIIAVNVADDAEKPGKPGEAKVQLACNTDRFHIVVDADGSGVPRYRSWNKPHAPPEKPALQLKGRDDGEGTGSCFHRIWRFKNANADYVLSEPGCTEDKVPGNAKAQLEVLIGGKSQLVSWCY